jgi:5-bromo-4-chloroindolyl phosphate hydrolysis protein
VTCENHDKGEDRHCDNQTYQAKELTDQEYARNRDHRRKVHLPLHDVSDLLVRGAEVIRQTQQVKRVADRGKRVAKLVRENTQKLPDLRWRTWARSFGSFGDHR